ncbi:pyrroloquinoline quinone biosynthesis peptide chaperone PqqD [Cohnella thailandensis]|uniref:Pyrroloquinoline quinone biosynthesis peptide chaperone PqqD n=1 Tax=Cohnella thailandensis TaxID=557557 RepID=A0A841T6H9_9BACL|nr:pyrroloquinoline quinone biosynthesis peptide chaperone PqqD [Cohnella thailandensis]MBB6638305.1 pyrroloquinoline quinone biosynthesis peptide chaperone PqqD [Cohnella thailandensis]MBP1977217.1 pyrroloquinoline quinone biosynthesis protein D [Cohnella thailandensis]
MSSWALSERPRLRSPGRLKYDKARQSDLLLLPERVVELNEAAGAILWLCDGNRSIAQLIQELEAKYGQTGLADDIVDFLASAEERGWLER